MAENRYFFLNIKEPGSLAERLCAALNLRRRGVLWLLPLVQQSWGVEMVAIKVVLSALRFKSLLCPVLLHSSFFYSEFVSCSANPHISFLIFKAHRVLFYPLSCSYFKRCWCLVRVFRKSQLFFTVTLGA